MDEATKNEIRRGLNTLFEYCYQQSVKNYWWHDLETGEPKDRNKGEMLMLIVSEVAETMEGERKNQMDDKLPHRPQAEVELADTIIRIGDYSEGFRYDVTEAIIEKLAFNNVRDDHKPENRRKDDGKKF